MAQTSLVVRLLAAVVVVAAFVPLRAEGATVVIGYPPQPKTEKIPANPYSRGCSPSHQCRGGRKLLAGHPLPRVSSHGLQHEIGN